MQTDLFIPLLQLIMINFLITATENTTFKITIFCHANENIFYKNVAFFKTVFDTCLKVVVFQKLFWHASLIQMHNLII